MTCRTKVDLTEVEFAGERFMLVGFSLLGGAAFEALTGAQREVAVGVMCGLSDREVAEGRGCSPKTVANLLSQIYERLRVSSRAELAAQLRGETLGGD